MPSAERAHELAGHKAGYLIEDGKVRRVAGEAECYRLARDPDYPEIQVFWTREGAETELAWRQENGAEGG